MGLMNVCWERERGRGRAWEDRWKTEADVTVCCCCYLKYSRHRGCCQCNGNHLSTIISNSPLVRSCFHPPVEGFDEGIEAVHTGQM